MAYLRVHLLPGDWGPGERPQAVDVTTVDGETFRYVERRTTHIVSYVDKNPASYGGRVHRCYACGKAFPKQFFRNGWTRLNYCPTCGALIEKE